MHLPWGDAPIVLPWFYRENSNWQADSQNTNLIWGYIQLFSAESSGFGLDLECPFVFNSLCGVSIALLSRHAPLCDSANLSLQHLMSPSLLSTGIVSPCAVRKFSHVPLRHLLYPSRSPFHVLPHDILATRAYFVIHLQARACKSVNEFCQFLFPLPEQLFASFLSWPSLNLPDVIELCGWRIHCEWASDWNYRSRPPVNIWGQKAVMAEALRCYLKELFLTLW